MNKLVYFMLFLMNILLSVASALLPVLPSTPFLLLAAYCLAKSSKRLHDWFVNTRLYKANLESYAQGKGMTLRAKIRIMGMITPLMAMGFIMMRSVFEARYVVWLMWLLHFLYLAFCVKTIPEAD